MLVTPLSGPLARYGRAGAIALDLWAASAGVQLRIIDAHPSATRAVVRALTDGPLDVLFGPYGAGAAVAAARAATYGMWNHGGATNRLARPTFPEVVNIPTPAASYLAAVIKTLDPATLHGAHAVLVHSRTGFGKEVADGALRAAADVGLTVCPVPFDPGGADAAARRAGNETADVLLAVGGFDDELAVAARLLRRRWRIAAFVAAGVDEILAPLAAFLDGVYGPCQWIPDTMPPPQDGPDARWFAAAYAGSVGAPPPYPAAAAYAAGVLWERCVRDANSTEWGAVQAAATRLTTTTLFGAFRLDPATGLQADHRVGVVQWREGRRVVISSPR